MDTAYRTWVCVACITIAADSALAQEARSAWDIHKGNCDEIFAMPEKAALPELKHCVALWESYRDVSTLRPGEREKAAAAFQRLFTEGDDEARHLARNALGRLGFTPKDESPEELERKRQATQEKQSRKKYRPHKADAEDQKAARKIRAQAYKAYKKGDCRKALALLEQALERDPGYVQAIYDSACCFALLGDKDNAVEYLLRLSDIGDKEAMEKLRQARRDKDFDALREEPEFKKATGFARIKVFNGMPLPDKEIGEDNVHVLVEMLRNPKLGYEVTAGGDDKHVRDRPVIWYKEHAKLQAYVIRKLIGHPRTILVPVPPDRVTEFDILISWADKVEADADGVRSAKYSIVGGGGKGGERSMDPEKKIDAALREQDEALRKPEEYARKTEHVLATPDRIQDKADSAVDRVESTVKTIERVGEKAGKILP